MSFSEIIQKIQDTCSSISNPALVVLSLLAVFLICFVVALLIRLFAFEKEHKWKSRVEESSLKLKMLEDINKKWAFQTIDKELCFEKDFSSKKEYNGYDFHLYFPRFIFDRLSSFDNRYSLTIHLCQ